LLPPLSPAAHSPSLPLRPLLLAFLAFPSGRFPDFDQAMRHASHPVARLRSDSSDLLFDPFHRTRQHTHAVSQQAAVSRVVDVGLHHRRVHSHLSPRGHFLFSRQLDDSCVNLACHLRTQGLPQPHHRLAIRNLLPANPRKVAILQVRSHFALQTLVAPALHVLQNHQTYYHFR